LNRLLLSHWRGGPIRYLVGDFEQVNLLQSLGLDEMKGAFDVVFAAWLLNYAADWHSLSKMLGNIFDALKPGGKFIGLTPNPFLLKQHGPEMTEEESRIGDRWQVTEAYDYGFKVHMIVNSSLRVEFDSYVLYDSEYDKAAEAAGFLSLSWQVMVPSDAEFERKDKKWWKPYIDRPRGCVVFATKPT